MAVNLSSRMCVEQSYFVRLTRDGHPVLMMNLELDTKLHFAAQDQSRGPWLSMHRSFSIALKRCPD